MQKVETVGTYFDQLLDRIVAEAVATAVRQLTVVQQQPNKLAYYNLTQASHVAGVALNTLRKWVHAGDLRVSTIDGVQRVKSADLEAFMTAHAK